MHTKPGHTTSYVLCEQVISEFFKRYFTVAFICDLLCIMLINVMKTRMEMIMEYNLYYHLNKKFRYCSLTQNKKKPQQPAPKEEPSTSKEYQAGTQCIQAKILNLYQKKFDCYFY